MNMFRIVDYGTTRMVSVEDMIEACGLLAAAYRTQADEHPDKVERFLVAEYVIQAFRDQLHQLLDDDQLVTIPDTPAGLFPDDTPPPDPAPTPRRARPRPTLWRRVWRRLFG